MIMKDDDDDNDDGILSKIKKSFYPSYSSPRTNTNEEEEEDNKTTQQQPPPYTITSEHISKAIEEIAANRVASMIDKTIGELYKEEEEPGEEEFSQESDEYVKRGDLYRVLKTLRENLGC